MRGNYQKILGTLQHSPTVSKRFWSAVQGVRSSHDCWQWIGDSAGGRLCLTVGQFTVSATRLAWYFATGEFPDGGQIRHRCDNEACVRPTHLVWEVGRVTALRLQGRASGYSPATFVPNPSPRSSPGAARLQFVIPPDAAASSLTRAEPDVMRRLALDSRSPQPAADVASEHVDDAFDGLAEPHRYHGLLD